MRLVALVLCVVVSIIDLVLDLIGAILNFLMSIPVIGAIIRTLLNFFSEWAWRLVNLPDFVLTVAGIMVPKKMFLKLIILNRSGVPITAEASVLPLIQRAQAILLRECNVELIYRGVCVPQLNSPSEAIVVGCEEDLFFSDFGVGGAHYELVSVDCGFEDGIRRATGLGAEMIAIVVDDIPGDFVGCSGWVIHNYVVLQDEGLASMDLLAHEIGHACILFHHDNPNNLMFGNGGRTDTLLTSGQRAWLRSSRHCVLF